MTKTEGALWSLDGGLIGAGMETFGDGSRDYLGRLVRLEREILLMYGVPSMEVLGAIAGFCTTFAFVPQIVKIHKQGGRDLSYGMLAFYLVGVLLWLGYGAMLRSPSVILTNTATSLLIVVAIVMKALKEKQAPAARLVSEQLTGRS
jgi:MtN3 and saliva related transmembrane protein